MMSAVALPPIIFRLVFRLVLSAGLLLVLALSVRAQDQPLLLDAGPGQRPFDVTRHAVPVEEIRGGGPPKDGIPPIDNPKFIVVAEANQFLTAEDRVLGVEYNGVAKAYPVRIMNWHEIVNDNFGGYPITVTW